jgi:hypothetical protein
MGWAGSCACGGASRPIPRCGWGVGTDALFWINLQVAHDLSKDRQGGLGDSRNPPIARASRAAADYALRANPPYLLRGHRCNAADA